MKKIFYCCALFTVAFLVVSCGGRHNLYGNIDTTKPSASYLGYVHYDREVFTFDIINEDGTVVKKNYHIVNSRLNFLRSTPQPNDNPQILRHYGILDPPIPLQIVGWVNDDTKSVMVDSFQEGKINCKSDNPACKAAGLTLPNVFIRATNDSRSAKIYPYEIFDTAFFPLAVIQADPDVTAKIKAASDNSDISTIKYEETGQKDPNTKLPIWKVTQIDKSQ